MTSFTVSMCSVPKGLVVASLCIASAGLLCCGGEGGRSRQGESSSPVAGRPPSVAALAPEKPSGIDANGELVLDDLTDGDELFALAALSGEWFTYSDGTSTVTPPDHTGLIVSEGETHVVGQGFSGWGVGLSAYLGAADLAQFCSLKLRARGSGAIVLEVATPATSPPAEGGTCMGTGCFGHFASNLQLEEAYRDFDIAFASLLQPSWAQPAQLSLAGVISFNLVAKGSAATPANIDLWVDRLALQACPL
jgi:hypothetical protein